MRTGRLLERLVRSAVELVLVVGLLGRAAAEEQEREQVQVQREVLRLGLRLVRLGRVRP
jgi:hypothetical protein